MILSLQETKAPHRPPSKASIKKESSIFQETIVFPKKTDTRMASHASTPQEGRNSDSPSETSTPAVDPARSPAGIFYLDYSNACYTFKPFSFNRPPQLQDPSSSSSSSSSPLPIPDSFIVCSSSKGLLLCYESDSNTFHLLNPFINESTRRIPDPPRYYNNHVIPTVVLSVEDKSEDIPAFSIICGSQKDGGRYSFDWYYSKDDKWHEDTTSTDIRPSSRLREETGIANDIGRGFWLTNDSDAIIIFDILFNSGHKEDLPEEIRPRTWQKQLGKVNETSLGVVAMRGRTVLLYLLDTRIENLRQYNWSIYRSLDLDQAGLGLGMSCSQELLRFDNDVPLWIGNQCILWEVTCGDEDDQNARFREFYGWEFAPLQESSTIPYIRSERTPAEFNIEEESDDETSDEEEEDGEERNNEQGILKCVVINDLNDNQQED